MRLTDIYRAINCMNEYAPEYSKREKMVLFVKYCGLMTAVLLFTLFYFMPRFMNFIEVAHCFDYAGFSGLQILFYGLFVAAPLSLLLIITAIEGPRNMQIMRLGQSPLPTEKVLRPTKYVYGIKAKIRPVLLLLALVCIFVFSMRGVYWANDFIAMMSKMELTQCDNR
ncbi:MAG: hypothetical protein COA76_03555 [Moritella sp.]|nr:MAG: hypothetical protein COA76_03555 [Moritella sp.]